MSEEMTREQHAERHRELHRALDELSADYLVCTDGLLSKTSVMDFLKWSYGQTLNPTSPGATESPAVGRLLSDSGEKGEHASGSAAELTLQVVRSGEALLLRAVRGSSPVYQTVLRRDAVGYVDATGGRGPIVVNGVGVDVTFRLDRCG